MPTRGLTLAELYARLEGLSDVSGSHFAIGVQDPAVARYARALEYGSVVGRPPWPRPGPRTTLAVDPESGATIVVSAQAPQGFIRGQAPAFPALAADALAAAVDWLDRDAVQAHIARTTRQAAEATLARMQAAVPRDSGKLAASLTILNSDGSNRRPAEA